MPRLIALDLASTVGYALLSRTMPRTPPVFGHVTLEGSIHQRLGEFSRWLPAARKRFGFDAMAWEAPIAVPGDTPKKLTILYGLVGIAHAYAFDQDLRWAAISVQAVKLSVSGNALADKDEMVFAAKRVGWTVANHHEADAGGVGVCAYPLLFPPPIVVVQ